MSKPLIKSRLLINNKHLGDLFYDKDAEGRGYLKLSFNNKIADFVTWTDASTQKPAPLPLAQPIRFEISYKFKDNLLALKKISSGSTERAFYQLSMPHTTCLFLLRIKDWHSLDDAEASLNPLVLSPSDQNSVAVIFSFLGADGYPFAPPEYSDMPMGCIDLPEPDFKKFCIGIAADPDNKEINDIVIMFPNHDWKKEVK